MQFITWLCDFMPDIIDDANNSAEQNLLKCIALARLSIPAQTKEVDDIACEECGDDIPAARRRALPGCRTCLPCQEEIEKNRRR
jgi:phage/conjugal plasmid C-4 type zinc finger TraR family protein